MADINETELPEAAEEGSDQLAQSTGEGQPIGQIETATGTVTVTHADGTQETADGTQETLEPGSPVFQGDTLETGDQGSVGVVLADETTFSMAEGGSMVLDEMAYDPATNEGSISLSAGEGVFTFVSGLIAKTDPDAMTLNTPTATIGIRGTQVGLDVDGSGAVGNGGGGTQVVLMEKANGFVCEVVASNGGDDDEQLFGGSGDDDLWGGDGSDTFVFHEGDGDDTVQDFGIGDTLMFEGLEFNLDDMIVTQDGDDAIVTFGEDFDVSVKLKNTDAVKLKERDREKSDAASGDGYTIAQGDDGVTITYDSGGGG